MENGEWRGEVKASLKFNDKEHQRIFDEVKEIRSDVVGLKIQAAKSGSFWGAITAAAVSIAAYVLNKFC